MNTYLLLSNCSPLGVYTPLIEVHAHHAEKAAEAAMEAVIRAAMEKAIRAAMEKAAEAPMR
jgi:hypothetical protein